MKLDSEQKKKLYGFMEKDEDLKNLVEPLKEDLVTTGRMESDLTEAQEKLRQFDGIDLADLKSKAKFVDENGGTKGLLDNKASAEGYAEDKERIARENAEVKKNLEDEIEKNRLNDVAMSNLKLTNSTLSTFQDNFNLHEMLLKNCIDSGEVYTGEDGTPYVKIGDSVKPLNGGGIDMLKERYKSGVKMPHGSGEKLNAPNDKNNSRNNDSPMLTDLDKQKAAIEKEFN